MELYLKTVTKRINDLYVPDMTVGTLDSAIEIDVEIRGSISLTTPIFILMDLPNALRYWKYNYAYCPLWERYYFIDDVTIDGHIMYIQCSEDYLASFYNELIESTFYCVRSYSDYDENLTDTFFPAKAMTFTNSVTVASPWASIKNGQYVVAISSGGNDVSHIGTNAYYILDDSEITDFMNDLMSKAEITISGLIDSLVKTMVNPMQYIRSCYWFPFELECNTESISKISFGWWSADSSAKVINVKSTADTYTEFQVEIPYSDNLFGNDEREYMKYAPYSQYRLACYPFGIVELSNDIIYQYVKGNSIIIQLDVDHITGNCTFILYCGEGNNIPHLTFTTQVAVEIPIGEILQDYAGTILNSAKAIGSAITGHEATALSDVYNAIDSVVPSATIQGMAGGFAQLMVGESWHLNRYYQDIEIDTELVGEPCCKNKKIGNLKGFAKFSNVEVEGNMLKHERDMIQSLLEDGIFVGDK